MLDGVDGLRQLLGCLVPDQAERGNVPDAVLEVFVELTRDRAVRAEQRHGKDGRQLHRLLLDGHLAQ
ncbi:MAG TPA: hypothetical protein VFG71_08545 [Nitrospiraceae bacterium]|nr:hypothetical protein [Nitrospiraceae bacterium]